MCFPDVFVQYIGPKTGPILYIVAHRKYLNEWNCPWLLPPGIDFWSLLHLDFLP